MPPKYDYHPSALTRKLNAARRRTLEKLKLPLGGVGSLLVAVWLILAFWLLFLR